MYHIQKSLSIAKSLFPKVYDTSINRNYHFCFVFKRNKLLTIGTNNMATESARVLKFIRRFRTEQEYMFRHAEVDAISRLWGRYHIDNSLYFVVIRLNRHRQLGDSRPCEYCQEILNALGITKVFWSNKNGTFSRQPI